MDKLSRFDIIVSVDCNNYIVGWHDVVASIYYPDSTLIMNKEMYEIIEQNIWNSRIRNVRCVVIDDNTFVGCGQATSLYEALQKETGHVIIIGGEKLYNQAVSSFAYLCDNVIISRISRNIGGTSQFPYAAVKALDHMPEAVGLTHEVLHLHETHSEQQYLNVLQKILVHGERRNDRTGVGTIGMFGLRLEFDLRKGFPLITTKNTWFRGIKDELLFFISGKTDTKILEDKGINIWKGNTSADFLAKNNLAWREGDMGPLYGFQWRHAGANYYGCDQDYTGQGVDQLANLVFDLINNPFSRRHIISAWDVKNISNMVLPPCHCFVQFYVGCNDEGKPGYLDALLYQRSADMFLGVPFNIASYALLMCIIGNLTGLIPRRFIHELGDAHIYRNHVEQVQEQLLRTPLPFGQVEIGRQLTSVDDITSEDIVLHNYRAWPSIKGDMAV